MNTLSIRKALKSDSHNIARCIAEGFERDFSFFCKDSDKVTNALVTGIRTERFYVAEIKNEIVAVTGISDLTGRSVYTDFYSLCKYFGWMKGIFAKFILKPEFEHRLPYPSDTGFIEFVAVRTSYRRQGIASVLLQESMNMAMYKDYVLDVIAENLAAMKCYQKLGFREFKRSKKQNGYTKIYMRKTLKAT